MSLDTVIYVIDAQDVIVSVSDNWTSFALANAWEGNTSPAHVIGKSLWQFVADREPRHLYLSVFEKVRTGAHVGPIPFRCDAPELRRFLDLELLPTQSGRIRLTSSVTRTERREAVSLLDSAAPRSEDRIRICSMCKKIALPDGSWIEIEEALRQSGLFEGGPLPALTHGLCPGCFETTLAALD